MTIRRSPLGYLIEEKPNGDLYLHETHDLMSARKEAQKEVFTTTYGRRDNTVTVFLSHRGGPAGPDNYDEWGSGPDHNTAWRYALGALFGSHEDPVVTYDPLLNEQS
jgi:hypothetical protein